MKIVMARVSLYKVMLAMVFVLLSGCANSQPTAPTTFDDAVAKAWKEAGAEIGWMRLSGPEETVPGRLSFDKTATRGSIPAFEFQRSPEGLSKLPVPTVPFGLSFSHDINKNYVTDALLKQLAPMKTLQYLNLSGETEVTDAGIKELAGLTQLQAIDLNLTQITDAGLKELSGLKQLKALYLRNTKVTDAGEKELEKAVPGLTIHHPK